MSWCGKCWYPLLAMLKRVASMALLLSVREKKIQAERIKERKKRAEEERGREEKKREGENKVQNKKQYRESISEPKNIGCAVVVAVVCVCVVVGISGVVVVVDIVFAGVGVFDVFASECTKLL